MLKSKQKRKRLAVPAKVSSFTDQPDLDSVIQPIDGDILLSSTEDKSIAFLVLDLPELHDPIPDYHQSSGDVISRNTDTLQRMVPLIDRKLADNGFVFWFPPSYPNATTALLENATPKGVGLRRMIWVKSCAAHAPVRHRIRKCHEVFYLIWPEGRDQPIPIQSLPDVLRFVPDDHGNGHEIRSIKPVALFERLIKACTNSEALVVDPFTGTGTSIEAALRLGRKVVGAELDSDARATANERLSRLRMDFFDDPITASFVTERGITI